MKTAIFLLAFSAFGQTAKIQITAAAQDAKSTATAFGRLDRTYDAVFSDLCPEDSQSFSVDLARIRQKIQLPNGVTLLAPEVASSVVEAAQGRAPLTAITRVFGGIAATGSAAIAIKAVPSGAVANTVLTVEGITILLGALFPALPSHAVKNMATSMLPPVLSFQSLKCVSGYSIVSKPKKMTLTTMSAEVTVPISGETKGQ